MSSITVSKYLPTHWLKPLYPRLIFPDICRQAERIRSHSDVLPSEIQDSARDKWRTWANFWREKQKKAFRLELVKGLCTHTQKAANEKGEGERGGCNFRRFSVCNPYRFLTLFLAMFFISLFLFFLFLSFLCPCFTKWLPAFCFECLFFLSFLDCWVGFFFFF